MRTTILILAALACEGARASDEAIPREGTNSATTMGNVTMKALPLGPGRVQLTWEFLGVTTTDDGKGVTHNASVRCFGAAQGLRDAYLSYENGCVLTRPDGDQIYIIETAAKTPSGTKGTSTFVGGTGKMAGITGTSEWVRYWVRPAVDGTIQTVTRSKISYKLP